MAKERLLEINKRLCEEWKQEIPKLMRKRPDKWWNRIKVDMSPIYTGKDIRFIAEPFKKALGDSLTDLLKLEVNVYYKISDGQDATNENIISGNFIPIARNHILFHSERLKELEKRECILHGINEMTEFIAVNFKP